MDPCLKMTINGVTVTEYYWAGKMVVYVDNRASDMTFDEAVKMLDDAEAARNQESTTC